MFNIYNEGIQRECKTLPGLIIPDRNLISIRYASETVFVLNIEGKIQYRQAKRRKREKQ